MFHLVECLEYMGSSVFAGSRFFQAFGFHAHILSHENGIHVRAHVFLPHSCGLNFVSVCGPHLHWQHIYNSQVQKTYITFFVMKCGVPKVEYKLVCWHARVCVAILGCQWGNVPGFQRLAVVHMVCQAVALRKLIVANN